MSPDTGLYLLSSDENQALLMALGRGRGGEGFTHEEAERLLSWANRVRTFHTVLELVLCGQAKINVQNGDVVVTASEGGKGASFALPDCESH